MHPVDWDLARFGWTVVVTLTSTIAIVYAWFGRRRAATQAAIDRVEEYLAGRLNTYEKRESDLNRRVTVAEEAMKFSPKSQDLIQLRDQIGKLADVVSRANGQQEMLTAWMARIDQHLIETSR